MTEIFNKKKFINFKAPTSKAHSIRFIPVLFKANNALPSAVVMGNYVLNNSIKNRAIIIN